MEERKKTRMTVSSLYPDELEHFSKLVARKRIPKSQVIRNLILGWCRENGRG